LNVINYFSIVDHFKKEVIDFKGRSLGFCEQSSFSFYYHYGIEPKDFVDKANELLNKYNINIPNDYPKECKIYQKLAGEFELFPNRAFIKCINVCILIEENYDIDTSKILRWELFKPNSISGIYHACSMSFIDLYYLNKDSNVIITKEEDNQLNPDLIIDNFKFDVKTIAESDWTTEINPETGQSDDRLLAEDLCYDLGTFIRNRGYKGIKQADVVFADLSQKAIGRLYIIFGTKSIEISRGLPELKKNRIIFLHGVIWIVADFTLTFRKNYGI